MMKGSAAVRSRSLRRLFSSTTSPLVIPVEVSTCRHQQSSLKIATFSFCYGWLTPLDPCWNHFCSSFRIQCDPTGSLARSICFVPWIMC
jgi:hypothetical protein